MAHTTARYLTSLFGTDFHSVAKTSINYQEAADKGYLATASDGSPALGYAGGYIYDLFNPSAREYAWSNVQNGYIKQYGLYHWWLDCNGGFLVFDIQRSFAINIVATVTHVFLMNINRAMRWI